MTEYVPAAKPVHLVKNFDEVPAKKKKWPMAGQVKHDGCYCFFIPSLGKFFSRTGEPVLSLEHMKDDSQELLQLYGDAVIIFEVMAEDARGFRWPVNEISGAFRRKSAQFIEAYGIVHDVIPFAHFAKGHSYLTYNDRLQYVELLKRRRTKHFKAIETFTVYNEEEAKNTAEWIIGNGGEGLVLKQLDKQWTAGKKDECMMKIKQEVSYDLRVNGVLKGEGKYENTLGTISVSFRRHGKKDGEPVNVVCSGMTDKQRDEWWANPSLILGQIVKVDGMCLTPDGMIREPRFKEVRWDKKESDIE